MDEVSSYISRQAVLDLMGEMKEIAESKTVSTSNLSLGLLESVRMITELLNDIHCVEVLYVKSKN